MARLSIPPFAALRRTLTGWIYGRPQAPGYVEQWTPVRFVREEQWCHLCWRKIPRGSPGRTRGTRGTRAWLEAKLGLWKCLGCHAARGGGE